MVTLAACQLFDLYKLLLGSHCSMHHHICLGTGIAVLHWNLFLLKHFCEVCSWSEDVVTGLATHCICGLVIILEALLYWCMSSLRGGHIHALG